MNPPNVPYEFNKIMLRLNRIRCPEDEKARLLATVFRSREATEMYLTFLRYGCEPVNPHKLGFKEGTTHMLLKAFSRLGLIEKAGRTRGTHNYLVHTWRLVC